MTSAIRKSGTASIMGALPFLGVKLMMHANYKGQTQFLEYSRIIYTNNEILYTLHYNHIYKFHSNSGIS